MIPRVCPPRQNDVMAFLDGKKYVLDGVEGVFKYEITRGGENRLHHEPTEFGKASREYQRTRAMLRDDWSSELTNDIERYCTIATQLGYVEPVPAL